jgi:chemotaxis signal transduction protein
MSEGPTPTAESEKGNGLVGGVVFRVGDARYFLPAAVACKVLSMPDVARVPGAPTDLVGVALVEGETVPVVAVGELDGRGSRRPPSTNRPRADNRPMLVCDVMGERVGLVGLVILATGFFPPAEAAEGVVHGDTTVPLFDVVAVVARLRQGRWAV